MRLKKVIYGILLLSLFSFTACDKPSDCHEASHDNALKEENIFSMTEEELREVNCVSEYRRKFGKITNKKQAKKIACQVLDEIYGDCSKEEEPFLIKYNKEAGAWIVQGTLPNNTVGGVGSIAIKKETGEIILIMQMKIAGIT